MTTATSCQHCDQRTPTGHTICPRCTQTLTTALANIAAYWSDIELIRTKRTRYGDPVRTRGSVGKVQPLPGDGRFLDPIRDGYDRTAGTGARIEAEVRSVVRAWTRTALETWPAIPAYVGPPCEPTGGIDTVAHVHPSCRIVTNDQEHHFRNTPPDHVPGRARYLAHLATHIARQPWAPQALDELLDTESRLRRFIDRPRETWYAGICGALTTILDENDQVHIVHCERELQAGDAPTIRCPDCGTTHDVAARRADLLDEAREQVLTRSDLARTIATLGDYGTDAVRLERRIEHWITKGKLTRRGARVIGGRARPLYAVGDVLALLDTEPKPRRSKAAG